MFIRTKFHINRLTQTYFKAFLYVLSDHPSYIHVQYVGGAYLRGGGSKTILGVCMFLWILLVVNLVTFMSFMYNSTNVDYFKEIYQFFGVCAGNTMSVFWGMVRQTRYLLVFGIRRWGRVYAYAEFKRIPLGPLLGLLVAPGSTTFLTDYLFTGKHHSESLSPPRKTGSSQTTCIRLLVYLGGYIFKHI